MRYKGKKEGPGPGKQHVQRPCDERGHGQERTQSRARLEQGGGSVAGPRAQEGHRVKDCSDGHGQAVTAGSSRTVGLRSGWDTR